MFRGFRPTVVGMTGLLALGLAAELAWGEMEAETSRCLSLREHFLNRLYDVVPGAVINGTLDARLAHNLSVGFPGVDSGSEVTLHYDPMIAKIVAHGEDRESARARLHQALRQTVLLGVRTNLAYLTEVLDHEAFSSGDVHTGFVDQHFPDWTPTANGATDARRLAAAFLMVKPRVSSKTSGTERPPGVWTTLTGFRLGSS